MKRSDQIKKNDTLTRKITQKRDSYCITCGSSYNLENGHFIPRRYLLTRWDLINNNQQCTDCNRTFHGRPETYRIKLVELYGEAEVKRLESLSRQNIKLSDYDLRVIEGDLKQELNNYE